MALRTLDDTLLEQLQQNPSIRKGFLFVEPHPTYTTHLLVSSFDASNPQKGIASSVDRDFVVPAIGPRYQEFLSATTDLGLDMVFMPGTQERIDEMVALSQQVPSIEINSTMAGTVKGMLPFQVAGFNSLKDELAGWLHWSTGTGKTVGAAALTKYHEVENNFDIAVWAVKAHNKLNTQRALKALVNIDAIVIAGTKAKRAKLYAQVAQSMAAGEQPTIIVNYEQFRGDSDFFKALFTGHKLMMILDEAPTKLRNRKTKTWKALASILYSTEFKGQPMPDREKGLRPSEFRAYVTSATPIENSPIDFFNVIRLIAPKALGSVTQFEKNHVVWQNMVIVGQGGRRIQTRVVGGYRNLDQIGIKVAHLTHQVDKADADIAAQFPAVVEDEIIVDLSAHQQKLYNKLSKRYADVIDKFVSLQKGEYLTDADKRELQKLRAVFTVLQMIVDDPALVLEAADRYNADPETGSEVAAEFLAEMSREDFEDNGEETRVAKTEALIELVQDNSDKVIAFSTHGAPYQTRVSAWLTKAGIGHVIYNGSMSMTQKQAAEDKFKSDPDCKLFLSSDAGSDSINLDCANLAVHINLPWKPATYEQRENRQHRITSSFDHVRVTKLFTETLPEEHKAEILEIKRSYQSAVKTAAAGISAALRALEAA